MWSDGRGHMIKWVWLGMVIVYIYRERERGERKKSVCKEKKRIMEHGCGQVGVVTS